MVRNEDIRKAAAIASQVQSKAYVLRALESSGGRTSASILQEQVRQAMERFARIPQEQIRQAMEGFAGVPQEQLRRATEGIAGIPQEQIRRTTEAIAGIPQERIRRATEAIARPYSHERLSEIVARFSGAYAHEQIARTLRESVGSMRPSVLEALDTAARRLEDQMREAEAEGPQRAQPMSLGWWLASRPLLVQLELLSLALAVLAAFSEVVEDVSGEDIPDPLQSTTALLFAMTAFLLAWIHERSKPPGDE
jgi:hypothetical protein